MACVDRFSVSLDTELLAAFDRHIAAHGYVNRSEAIRDLIRNILLAGRLEDEKTPVRHLTVSDEWSSPGRRPCARPSPPHCR